MHSWNKMKTFFYFIGLFFFVFSFFYSLFCTAQNLNEIRNLRAGKHQNFYRVVLETSMKVDTKIELKTLPYRAIIQIPESLWRASNIPRKGNFYPNIPIIYSFKNDEIGKTNLTLNIEKPFSLDKVYWLSSPNGNKRLVIDLYFSSETDFIVTKKSFESFSKEEFESVLGEKPISEDKELELFIGQNKNNSKMSQQKNIISEYNNLDFDKEGTKNFLVVIDPGHGGKDPGAIGYSKTLEKDINLIASKILQSKLNNISGIKAYLTRSDDIYINLHDRYKIANQLKADIFISLHSDASETKSVRGYSIFSLNKDPDLEKANFQKNNKNQNVLGNVILDEEIIETQNILYKMYQRRKRNYSIKLKNLILDELSSLPSNSRGWHEKNFAVLKSPVIPSVLIEMGFISNKEDEKNLNDREFISNLMQKIAVAVTKYKDVYMK